MGKKNYSSEQWANSEITDKPAARKSRKGARIVLGSDRPAKSKTASRSAKKTAAASRASQISREEIALRAYFIAEKRHREGLPGDEHHDWLEAERQIRAERKPKRKKATTA